MSLGYTVLISAKATNVSGNTANLAVVLDPIFYFWNPFNRSIKVENLLVKMGSTLPGRIALQVTNANGGVSTLTLKGTNAPDLDALMTRVATSSGGAISFMIKGPFTMAPGEIIVASAGVAGDNEATLGYTTNNKTGIVMTKLNGNNTIKLNLSTSSVSLNYLRDFGGTSGGSGVRHSAEFSLPAAGTTPTEALTSPGDQTQYNLYVFWSSQTAASEYVSPDGDTKSGSWAKTEQANNLANTKAIFGALSLMIKPASPGGQKPVPSEIFARLNPFPWAMNRDYYAPSFPNQNLKHVVGNSATAVLDELGMDFSGSARGGFWGLSYQSTGTTSLVMSDIPSSPLISLASFSHANVSVMGTEPFHAIGNSWSSALFEPTSAYGEAPEFKETYRMNAQDLSWLLNDALFDRYYLSGMGPDYTIGASGYSTAGTINTTLSKFFTADYRNAKANPVLRPYLPAGTTAAQAIAALNPDAPDDKADGYKKIGAYSLIDGAFNVNSTSVTAWESFLRANRNLAVNFAQGAGTDSNPGAPFPSSPAPSGPGTSPWSGFARLSDAQISDLAAKIVAQGRLRGPFMSISDFVNHRMSDPVNTATSYTGALQAALDLSADGGSGINSTARTAAKNSAAVDSNSINGIPTYAGKYFNSSTPVGSRRTTTGIPGDLIQADLLLPLAPRLTARADTFRIRSVRRGSLDRGE